MKAYTKTTLETLGELGVSKESGLSDKEVEKSRSEHGANAFEKSKPVSMLSRILKSLGEPMIIMLIVAAIIALGVNIVLYSTSGEADFFECIGIFAAISLSVIITVSMEGRSAKAFEALSKINEDIVVKVIRNGSPVLIRQNEIVVGDIVVVQTGDRIPADGRIIENTSLKADESSLTGESNAVGKDYDVIFPEKTPVAARINMLYSGSYITEGSGKIVITEVGSSTEFGKIATELSKTESVDKSTPLQEKLAKLGKIIAIFGCIAAAIAFIVQLLGFISNGEATFTNIADAFITSVVLIVAAVPEGLPTIVAASLAISVIKMSKQNALVKKMVACETIGCVNIICSDKTGTLTENRMTVINEITNEWIIKNVCINSTADIDCDGSFIGNPTECALLKKVGDYTAIRAHADITDVIPFSSKEKSMTTTINDNGKKISYIKGSPEKIISICNDSSFEKEIVSYQEKACRIIAFAHDIGNGFVFDGFAAITDPLREDVYDAVKTCKSAGISLKILTGDNIITAKAIADQLNLLSKDSIAVEAQDLEHLSDDELSKMLPKIRIIARSTPIVKMRVVKLLKAQGHVIAVTGDGINDAPAIKNADVGIAMGITGTEVSKEAADIILLNDSFATITKAVQWGRGIYENFQRFIVFQLSVNVSSVLVVLASVLLGLGTPFTALQLLWINIIMDGPPALALGLEPIKDNLMERKPTRRDAGIITKSMISRIAIMGIFMAVVFMLESFFGFLGGTKEQSATILFNLFAVFQLFNALNSRELGSESIFKTFFKNRMALGTIGIAFVMQVIIVQFGGTFFKTVPLTFELWIKTILIALSVVVISEVIRLLTRILKKEVR